MTLEGNFFADLVASLGDQPVSAYSHFIAAGVALAAAVPLVRLGRASRTRVVALTIYVSCVVIALAISGAYHSCDRGSEERNFMRRLDYYAIWALIAGTFTALHGTMWRGFWRTGVLSLIWSYALVGIVLQVLWFRVFSGPAGLALYLGMGWIGLASIAKLSRQLGFAKVLPFIYSGVAFSAGAILEACGWPVIIEGWMGPHEIFHFAVVVGCALNWLFIRHLLMHHAPIEAGANDFPTVEHTLVTDAPNPASASGRNVAA